MATFKPKFCKSSKELTAYVSHMHKVAKTKLVLDDIHKIAVLLNPATKTLQLFPEEQDMVRSLVRSEIASLSKDHLHEESHFVHCEPVADIEAEISASKFMTFAEDEIDEPADELERYLKLAAPSKSLSILNFWINNKQLLPCLYQVAIRVFSVQATSVASERLFSDAANIMTDQRSRLAPEKLDDTLFLKWNLNL